MQKINEEFVDHINYFNEIMANRIVVSKNLQKKFLECYGGQFIILTKDALIQMMH